MVANQGVLIVGEDMIVRGEIRNCRQMEIYGYVEGNIAGDLLIVRGAKHLFAIAERPLSH